MFKTLQDNSHQYSFSEQKGTNEYADRKNYSYYAQLLLANYSMPTLIKSKPSNLISINKKIYDKKTLMQKLNHEIGQYGCQSVVLYENENMINLIIYNEELLYKVITFQGCKEFLYFYGYELRDNLIQNILNTLKIRFEQYHSRQDQQRAEFPHEIGIILGYPLRDVEDFVRYQGKNYIFSGCWKVYHNEEEALRVFETYRKIRRYSIEMIKGGKKLKDIINSINI